MHKTKSKAWIIFAATCFLFTLSQFYKTSIAVITPQLMNDLALDAKGLSLMSAVFFYAFALAQFPMGVYLDRIGPRRIMSVLSLIAAVGVILFACSRSLGLAAAGRALMGFGTACNLMGSFKLLTLWFSPVQFATLSAMITSIGALGTITAATPLVLMVEGIGWRAVFALFAAATLIASALFYLVVRDRRHETPYGQSPLETPPPPQKMFATLGRLFESRDYWIISLGSLGRFGVIFAFQGLWAGPYLMQVMGYSPVKTGNMIFILNIGYIVGCPLFGMLSDRVFRTRKWIVVLGLGAHALIMLAFAMLPTDTSAAIVILLFFSFGFFFGAGMVMYAHIKELMPPEMSGTAMAGINFFGLMGVGIFLHGLGHLMQALYPEAPFGEAAFRMTYGVCFGYLLIATTIYLFTRDSVGKRS
jgi:sugar phosphate permease